MDLLTVLTLKAITLSPGTLFLILGIACLLFLIATLVLLFHWNNYGIDQGELRKIKAVYFIGGFLFLLLAIVPILFHF